MEQAIEVIMYFKFSEGTPEEDVAYIGHKILDALHEIPGLIDPDLVGSLKSKDITITFAQHNNERM